MAPLPHENDLSKNGMKRNYHAQLSPEDRVVDSLRMRIPIAAFLVLVYAGELLGALDGRTDERDHGQSLKPKRLAFEAKWLNPPGVGQCPGAGAGSRSADSDRACL